MSVNSNPVVHAVTHNQAVDTAFNNPSNVQAAVVDCVSPFTKVSEALKPTGEAIQNSWEINGPKETGLLAAARLQNTLNRI